MADFSGSTIAKKIKNYLKYYQWSIVFSLAAAAWVLGFLGFRENLISRAGHGNFSELSPVYLAFQLFVMNSGYTLDGLIGWKLEVSRLLAPAVFFYTAFKALAALMYDQFSNIRLQYFVRDHIIVCGLGFAGMHLVSDMAGRRRVVVIERDRENDMINVCREMGAIVLTGDATDPETLKKARLDRALHIIAVCGEDGTNAAVAASVRKIFKQAKTSLKKVTCHVHVSDLQLCILLKEREIMGSDAFRLEFFNIYETAAKTLTSRYLQFKEPEQKGLLQPHILMIGFGSLGESMVVHTGRSQKIIHECSGHKMQYTIIDNHVNQELQSLVAKYPHLPNVCKFEARQADLQSPYFRSFKEVLSKEDLKTVTTVFVYLPDQGQCMSRALLLIQEMQLLSVPVVVCMDNDNGMPRLLREADPEEDKFRNLHSFAMQDETCNEKTILEGTHEILAKHYHNDHLKESVKMGKTAAIDEAMKPWEELAEEYREANRQWAYDIGKSLRKIGCDIEPLFDWNASLVEFTEKELEDLAKFEHLRWCNERRDNGWQYGEEKSESEKTNPNIVGWEKVSPGTKQYNLDKMKKLPAWLAEVGFLVYRSGAKNHKRECKRDAIQANTN